MDAAAAPPRVVIESVESAGTTQIRLRRGTQVVEGRTRPEEHDLAAVVHATLSALDELTPSTVAVTLDELHRVGHRYELVIVLLTVRVAGVPLPHVGSAIVGDDPELAVVKAVLDALNRRLQVIEG